MFERKTSKLFLNFLISLLLTLITFKMWKVSYPVLKPDDPSSEEEIKPDPFKDLRLLGVPLTSSDDNLPYVETDSTAIPTPTLPFSLDVSPTNSDDNLPDVETDSTASPIPTLPFPLDEETRARLIAERNELLVTFCQSTIDKIWPKKVPTLKLHKIPAKVKKKRQAVRKRYQRRNEYFEIDSDQDDRLQATTIHYFEDTKKVTTDELETLDRRFFDYYKFQRAIYLQTKEDELKFLETNLQTNRCHQTYPDDRVIATEFQNIYGPLNLDKSDPLITAYLKCYSEYKEESAKELNKTLEFLTRVSQIHGKDVVAKFLEGEQEHLECEKTSLRTPSVIRSKIYDMNPYTNPTHSDWFLLPRPAPPRLSNLFIRHFEFEKDLIEFQMPSKLKDKMIILNGYWPSVVDYNLIFSTSKCYIATDPCRNAVGFEMRESRSIFWLTLHDYMINEIELFPLGIEMNSFFERIQRKYRYVGDVDFFPGLTTEEAVNQLPGMFTLSTIDSARKMTILFPSFLRGIIPESSSSTAVMEILHKIWLRIGFLVVAHGGKLSFSVVIQLYSRYFGINLNVKNWRFKSTYKFVRWCQTQWSGANDPDIELVNVGDDVYLVHRQSP